MYEGKLTDVAGLRVGSAQNEQARTGCTVVLAEGGAVSGVSVRGAAPGTRETDVSRDANLVERIDAVLLSGGSAYGLDAAGGVMRYLEAHEQGYAIGDVRVPIVQGAVIYDLGVGDAHVRPDAPMGYAACEAAGSEIAQGSFGAGCGATVGKALGDAGAMRGGLGTASMDLGDGVRIAALVAVNAMGDVVDEQGVILAGARLPSGAFLNTWRALCSGMQQQSVAGGNTTIGVVATNAKLTRSQAKRLAESAHDGYALAIRPVHTLVDGDTIFALSTGDAACDMITLCTAAAEVTRRAICNAVEAAQAAL
nr:P1 family peptidase [Maliibacterium massiliense]